MIQSGALTANVADGLDLKNFLQTAPFEVVFSEPMDPSSGNPALLTYPYVPGTIDWSQNNTHLLFHPSDGFAGERAYHLFLDRDLKSASGRQFENIQQWQIQVLPGPHVMGHLPQGPNLTQLQPVITLNFDREMDPKSVKGALHMEPALDFTVEVKDRAASIKLQKPFALGQSYRFTLDRSARDVKNVPIGQEYSWQYWVPEMRAEAEISNETTIVLKFNYPVQPEPSTLPFKLEPATAGKWSWSGQSVLFKAEQPLPYATKFTVQSDQPLKGDTDVPLVFQPVTITRTPPINSVFPQADGELWYFEEGFFSIDFSIPMDHASTQAAFQVSPKIAGHFEWKENQMRYLLDDAMENNTDYTLALAPSARSADGKRVLLDPYTWSFRSGYPYYSDQPALSFGCEGGNAQVVDANGRRSIGFDHGEIAASAAGFSLYPVDLPTFADLYRKYYRERGYVANLGDKDHIPTEGLERASYWQEKLGTTRVQETHIPSNVPTGLYILNGSLDGKVQDQLLVALTSNTLVVKESGGRLWAWASDINGQNVAELEMRLYTQDGSLMREGKTDADGIYETSLPKDSPPMLIAGRAEGDNIAIAGFGGDWSSNWWGYSSDALVNQRAYVYTDRPIYKPGHTIHFKTILREDDDARYSLPEEGFPVHIRVLDPRDNEIYTFDLKTNAFGTVNGEFTVAEGAGLGEYIIRAEVGEAGARETAGQVRFKVEDYRKPEFQVSLAGEKDLYVDGDTISVDINTRYFFDEPVPDAALSIRTYTLSSWYWWYEPDDFSQQDRRYTWYPQGDPIIQYADQQGHYQYTTTASAPSDEDWYSGCRASWRSSLRRCTIAIEVTAKDASGQSASGFRIIEVYNAAEKYSLDSGSWVKKPGEKFSVHAQAVKVDGGEPVANTDLRLDVLGWSDYNYQRSEASYRLTTDATGSASQEITLPTSGSYRLKLSPYKGDSSIVSTSNWIYVYSGADRWANDAWGAFSISAEVTHYKPYQKARLAIQSNFSGPALLTFERGRVIHQQPVMLTAPLTTVETEIIPEYAPNVYVVVNAWQPVAYETSQGEGMGDYGWTRSNSDLQTEKVELQVENTQKALNITITPDQERYTPRSEANLEIQVSDAQNQPVEAELSLALVDEAIFSLSDELAGPIFNAFYGRRLHSVYTSDSLAISRTLGMCGGGRGGGGGGDINPANPRSDFPDTAAWLPVIQTDANGKASVKLTLPDSLTTWRVMVKAVTRQTLVGQVDVRIPTHQEVIVQPVMPRALTAGDQFEMGALVHNYTGQAGSFMVSLSTELLEMLDDARQQVSLQAGEVRLVTWKVKAAKAGETDLTISAAVGDQQDAVRLPLVVRPRGMPEVDTQVGEFQHEVALTLVAPETMLDISTVEFKLSRSVAGSLLDGVDYLTGYPYGCVEQTMSRALPNAVVGRAFNLLGVENPNKAKLNDMINASVQRLYGFQHSDGGWGWWHDDESTPYQTAWVVFGLSVTAEAGYPVDPQVIKRGADYLRNQLSSTDENGKPDLRTQAYILYSLANAGQGSRERTLALAESAQELDAFSQAALALALHKLGEDEAARPVLNAMMRSAHQQENLAFWEIQGEDGQYHSKTMASSVRTTALALDALLQIDPQNEMIPDIARYLMNKRRANGWGTTNETAFTILALTDHLQQLKATGEDVSYTVMLNDQELSSGTLAWGAPLLSISIHADQLKPGINLLRVTQTGDSTLFYTLTSRMVLDAPEVAASGTVEITREYVQPETNKPVEKLKIGDLVRVRLTAKFTGGQASYVILEDPLPGALEAVNERLNNSTHYGGRDYYSDDETYLFFWQDYGYNQKEIYGDRVSFFVTQVDTGSSLYTVDYLARVTQTGDFLVPPAQVYAMYDETVWGRSSSGALSVQAEE